MSFSLGTQLGHYDIVERIGSGGMGDVYLAHDTKLSRKVALKVLPAELTENESRRKRFEREATVLAALNHPNIVTIYSVEREAGVDFITMEFVQGRTLSELLPRDGLPLGRFFDIAIPLADAVAERNHLPIQQKWQSGGMGHSCRGRSGATAHV